MLSVVEPMNVGPAGDLFAIIYIAKENKLYALNASGKAPSGATVARMKKLGYAWDAKNWGPGSGMPDGGILSVTVPGAVWGWDEVQRRFGSLTFKETLQPAIDYAEQGFPISERIAHDWELPQGLPVAAGRSRASCCTQLDPDSIATWYIDGQPADCRPDPSQSRAREDFPHPAAAGARRLLQRRDRAGDRRQVEAPGGTMTLEDLAAYSGEWVDAGDHELSRLRRLHAAAAGADLGRRRDAEHSRSVRAEVGAGPDAGDARSRESEVLAPVRRSEEARVQRSVRFQRRSEFLEGAAGAAAVESSRRVAVRQGRSESRVRTKAGGNAESDGDTIVLSTADRSGNMVAWVNSLYYGFGSGLTVPGYGITLHDRGGFVHARPEEPERRSSRTSGRTTRSLPASSCATTSR